MADARLRMSRIDPAASRSITARWPRLRCGSTLPTCSKWGYILPQLLRLINACLGVAILVALQAHGVIDTRHRIDHSLQFPGVSYAEAAAIDHDHKRRHTLQSDHEHEHDQPQIAPSDNLSALDVADGPENGPIKHHHHGGVELPLALALPLAQVEDRTAKTETLALRPGLAPSGLRGGGLFHPPKQQRLIA